MIVPRHFVARRNDSRGADSLVRAFRQPAADSRTRLSALLWFRVRRAAQNRSREIAGFSLVEVMVAVLILGVALVGLTQGITTALSSTKESELQTAAALIAAGQIEELRAEGLLTEGVTDGEGGEGLSIYRWKQTITRAPIDGLYEVSVQVEHTRSGKPVYELRTMLFEPPSDSSTEKDRKSSSRSNEKGGRK